VPATLRGSSAISGLLLAAFALVLATVTDSCNNLLCWDRLWLGVVAAVSVPNFEAFGWTQ
jgi:hypothetical protein